MVGSFPTPEWLRAYPSRDHLRDATLVVVRAQELAGIDVVSDGELSRFDVNHPETNGMIDYFVGQLDGVRTRLSARTAPSPARRMSFRAAPAGAVAGPLGPGTLDLPVAAAPPAPDSPGAHQVHPDQPLHAGQVPPRPPLRRPPRPHPLPRGALREQVRDVDADVIQVDEANLPGHLDGPSPRRPSTPSWKGCRRKGAGPAPLLRQLRRANGAEGPL